MPYVEFSTIDDLPAGTLIPDGIYTARVEGIEERRTRKGSALWRVCLRIIGGGQPAGSASGRCVFDNWAFSPRALPRLKRIVALFGIDVEADREITPRDFIGREVDILVRSRRYELDGEEREENFVPYGGYRKAVSGGQERPARQDGNPLRRDEIRPRREANATPRDASASRRDATRPRAEEEVPF